MSFLHKVSRLIHTEKVKSLILAKWVMSLRVKVTSSPQNAFVQLSLAFRNDNYTLETRLKQAERERHLTEEDAEKELEEFKGSLKVGP